jgi:Flp pilus assembly protein TadG
MRRSKCSGGSALEMAFLLPWYLFLFVGAFDWGFYAHALISTESAARVAALWASGDTSKASDSNGACTYALEELKIAPNVGSVTCPATTLPVIVTAALTPPDSPDGQPGTKVAVTYQTTGVIPIPGLLKKQATFYRVVWMRLRS